MCDENGLVRIGVIGLGFAALIGLGSYFGSAPADALAGEDVVCTSLKLERSTTLRAASGWRGLPAPQMKSAAHAHALPSPDKPFLPGPVPSHRFRFAFFLPAADTAPARIWETHLVVRSRGPPSLS